MNITDDVIRDLLPLYATGEASTDTRALVEAYLATHPNLAREAEAAAEWSLPGVAGPSNDVERRALRETKKRIQRRTYYLPLAIFLSTLPLSFRMGEGGFDWLFWPEHVTFASISLALGLAFWIAYIAEDRKLRPKGF